MSLRTWLAGMLAGPPAPLPRIEPAIAAGLMAPPETKQAGDIVSSLNSMAFPQPLLYAAPGGYASNTGVPVTPFTALQSAAVYGCSKCISEDIACLPLQVRRRTPGGGWVIDDKHPLNRLFRRPNRLMTAFQFWCYLLTAYCLRGNAYAVIERGPNGEPIELIPVTPDRVTVKLSVVDGAAWYLVNAKQIGIGVWVAPEDMLHMLHMRNLSVDGYLGLSPIACAQDVIGLALAAQQHGAVLSWPAAAICRASLPHTRHSST
jgi:phage portal protein BeeE